ncbi:MAG: Rab family GTPase [Candidatus Thorarchaeota archaeon]
MNGSDPTESPHPAKEKSSSANHADFSIPPSLKKKLETETQQPAALELPIKSVIAVKESGLPLFHIDFETETDAESTSVLAGLTSALTTYASQAVRQEIQELSLEDDKVVFLSAAGLIFGVVAEKTVPSSILRTIATESFDLISTRYSEMLTQKHVHESETGEITEAVHKIVQAHAKSKPAEEAFKKFLLKIVLLGDGGVGKTSLFNRFMGKGFKSDYLMTIGADFGVKKILLGGDREVKFLVVDIAGQPHFREVRKAFYQGTYGAFIVVDITRPETFKNSVLWLNDAWKHGAGPYPVIFLGNKNDLRASIPYAVGHDRIRKLTTVLSKEAERSKGFEIPYLPTSAKTGLNVDLAFKTLGNEIIKWLMQHRLKKKSP